MVRDIFIRIVDMSYQAAMIICLVFIARIILNLVRAPHKFNYYLWAIPFVKMCFPFQWESIFSFMPNETILTRQNLYQTNYPRAVKGTNFDSLITNTNQVTVGEQGQSSMHWLLVFQWIWIIGVVLILVFSIASYIHLKRELRCSLLWKDNIFITDQVCTSFVIGLLKPRIYIHSFVKDEEFFHVLAHEKIHIKRKDPLIKILVFIITVIHWFNPLAWFAYICMTKDMELSCDEAVMQNYSEKERKEYATTLLNLSIGKKTFAGIPIAFLEGSTKERIKNVIQYKKPALLTCVLAILLLLAIAVGSLTKPDTSNYNRQMLKKAILELPSDETKHYMEDVVPFEWTKLYIFYGYMDSHLQEEIMGIKNYHLKLSEDESKVQLVFINKDEVVCSVLDYPDNLGYSIVMKPQYNLLNSNYSVINREDRPLFVLEKDNQILQLIYEPTNETKELEVGKSTSLAITTPKVEPTMQLGADGAILDYADGDIVIFHGYFGLFVFSTQRGEMIGAIDLADIGCEKTQGDNACEVSVAKDGTSVYLHPMSEKDMYVYQVMEQTLWKEPYSLNGLELFDSFSDGNMVELANGYDGYLSSADGSIGELCYIQGDMLFLLFEDYFKGETAK